MNTKRIVPILLMVLLVAAFSAGPVLAAKGGNGNPSTTSSIALEPYSDLRLGGTVGFETNAVGLAGWEYPMVTVWCYQDLNGDGIHQWPDDGGDLVYAEMRKPEEELVLGGAGSIWLWNGGPAECWAVLYAYGWKGGQESTRELASVGFHADG